MFLKQSTAVTIVLPRFVDSTDGNTAETALTISQSDVRLSKNAGAFAQKAETSSCTHLENGFYSCALNTTDTGTLGLLTVAVAESGALSVERTYVVVPANWYDSQVLGTDLLQVDVEQIDGSATAATNQSVASLTMQTGTVDTTGFSPTSTEFETSSITEATASHYVGKRVYFTSGALQYQGARITAYSLSSGRGHFTTELLTDSPANAQTFIIV
jgi:hypothetical protein